jgi:hypothetical protein
VDEMGRWIDPGGRTVAFCGMLHFGLLAHFAFLFFRHSGVDELRNANVESFDPII